MGCVWRGEATCGACWLLCFYAKPREGCSDFQLDQSNRCSLGQQHASWTQIEIEVLLEGPKSIGPRFKRHGIDSSRIRVANVGACWWCEAADQDDNTTTSRVKTSRKPGVHQSEYHSEVGWYKKVNQWNLRLFYITEGWSIYSGKEEVNEASRKSEIPKHPADS